MHQQPAVAPNNSLEKVSIWALIITLIVSAAIFFPFSMSLITVKTFVLAGGALITLALYILARLSRGNIISPPFLLVGALWLPAIAYALSSVFSGIPFSSALWGTALEPDTFGFIIIATFLGTLAAFILRRQEQYRLFFRVGAWLFGVVTAIQVLILIVGQFSSKISPAFSILGSFKDLSFLLGLGIVSILISFRFLDIKGHTQKLLIAGGVLALFLLALANSYVVWVLLALVSLGLFIEAVMQRSPKTAYADDIEDADDFGEGLVEMGGDTHSLITPLIVLVISLFFIIGGTLGGALANWLHINELSVSPSWQSTFSVARNVYSSSPVFGSGPGTFGVDWLKYRDASLNSTVFWNTNFSSGIGFVPTSFVTTGLLGVLAWVLLLGLFVAFGLRMLIMRTPTDAFTRYIAILSFVSALYLFTITIFGLPNAFIIALAFVFVGIFASTMRFAESGRQWGVMFSRKPKIGFMIVFALTLLLLGAVFAAYTLTEHYIATAELASASNSASNGDLDSADKAIQSSISFAPSASAYQMAAGIANARLSQIAASTTMSTTTAQQAFQSALSSGINSALTATNIAPNDYQNWIMLGNLYADAVPLGVSGAYNNAKTAYEKAVALNPTNPQIHYILAQLNMANKDIKSAQDDLKAAITLKQDYTDAIFLLSQLEVQDGNVKDALSSALAAAYFTPNNPSILFQVGILYAATNDLSNAAVALEAAVNANPQFANARYFLAAVYAKQHNMKDAVTQMQAIADMSAENAKAVAPQIQALNAGTNPFPANLLSTSSTPVKQ